MINLNKFRLKNIECTDEQTKVVYDELDHVTPSIDHLIHGISKIQ